jgi:hypothetical protein
MFSPDVSALAGGAQTGLTSPTYDLSVDVAPDNNGKQYAVTAKGGTQTNVRLHTISDPFTVTFNRPKVPRTLPAANPVTGKRGSIPRNSYSLIIRKGTKPESTSSPEVALVRCQFDIPAGADAADADNVRAAISLLVGILSDQSAGIGDSLVSGII